MVRSTTVSVWTMGTRGLSSIPCESCHALRPSGPNRSIRVSLGHGGYISEGVEVEPVKSDLQVGGHRGAG